jgi:uncharacterized repeat protein (TIGR04138 family)
MALDFEEEVRVKVLVKDSRYPIEAYRFVMEALEFTIEHLGVRRHVTGQELLEGIRDFARREFGVFARTVFQMWNISQTNDFGNLVFNMVNVGLMGKTEKDTIDDFKDLYSFEAAFPTEVTSEQLFETKGKPQKNA